MAENGNVVAMREALFKASDVLTEAAHHNLTEEYINECLALIHDALAAPLRNCDIGTAEEQEKRFDKFCDDHDCKSDCPLFKVDSCCEFAWAQMPYEEAANG